MIIGTVNYGKIMVPLGRLEHPSYGLGKGAKNNILETQLMSTELSS